MKAFSRRKFIRDTSLAAVNLPLLAFPQFNQARVHHKEAGLEIHIFSKHLQFLDLLPASEIATSLGFSGLDLTIRPKGHIEPEQVKEKLPEALEAIRSGGSQCRLITTAVEDLANNTDKTLLETAASAGITHYRTNWYHYHQALPMKESLALYGQQITRLSEFNEKLGLTGCYQNHAGKLIGASIWEVDRLLETANGNSFGIQYDIRHATVEGGLSWENGLRLVHNKIKTIVLKDFKWNLVQGQWKVVNTPIGEGMVDFKRYFKLLKMYKINVPATLHLEYPLGGAEHGEKKLKGDSNMVYRAMKKDLNTLKELWEQA
jgi:sugar phosphate isomerase/epimerase